jgi:hypothetical protein
MATPPGGEHTPAGAKGPSLKYVHQVLLGYLANQALQEDQKRRAYIELLSRREEADGNIRKDMFNRVIDQFITPGKGELENRILNLELLAYNFHESIDLAPLLKQVYQQSWSDQHATSKERKRLQTLAQDIVARELVALAEAGCAAEGSIHFSDFTEPKVQPKAIQVECPARRGLPAKTFSADVMSNPYATDLRKETEVDVVLWTTAPERTPHVGGRSGQNPARKPERFEFTVSPFDFPMIDNVRLSDGGRVSLAMSRVDDGGATLVLVYFPDSRTSLRDKPFHDEVLKALDEAAKPADTRH